MLTIHARTRQEMSKAPAHWEVFSDIIKLRDEYAPATKIVGNDDITSRQQGIELVKQYHVDGIMIGRGVFQDPFVFSEQSPWSGYLKDQKLALFEKHVRLFAQTWQNDERPPVLLNKFCKIYIQGFDGAKELREKLMGAHSTSELLELLSTANV